jgi:hypothetical protein
VNIVKGRRIGNSTERGKSMNKIDDFIMLWAGKILMALGIGGAILTASFDQISRGMPFNPGWLQVSGLVVFIALIGFGYLVDSFLATVREMLK